MHSVCIQGVYHKTAPYHSATHRDALSPKFHEVGGGSSGDARRSWANRPHPPSPGASEKYFSSLPVSPSCSSASGIGSFLVMITGQSSAYLRLNSTHFSISGSVSGRMASAGHSGSHTPQSMHSSGWITSAFSPS